ncbi:hypothetical protein EVAR_32403_1 [Eumeta japonica]|uniref:Uncharacterized protein n=1 Tax=Eumeta variegata TaxID=151549 RepID=A0A4C1VKR8_EUMVA|nr:hypothetical protein EVAR_32403_1 [Eumeta japonica]
MCEPIAPLMPRLPCLFVLRAFVNLPRNFSPSAVDYSSVTCPGHAARRASARCSQWRLAEHLLGLCQYSFT